MQKRYTAEFQAVAEQAFAVTVQSPITLLPIFSDNPLLSQVFQFSQNITP